MDNFVRNLVLWWEGWQRFHEITDWKPDWGPDRFKWWLMYATDYLATPLFLGGPVVSLSRYSYDYFGFTGYHFAHAGPVLWGSVRSKPWVRVVVPTFWLVLLWVCFG